MNVTDCGKQRLRPWLEGLLNSATVEGLYWLNTEKTKCRVPWHHGGKQDSQREHGRIFMEWAKHTGRYREGVDEEQWVTWKTRLRCALNKSTDIVELKTESQVGIDCDDPFKVYEFKPRQFGRKKPTIASQSTVQSNILLSASQCSVQPAPLPAVLDCYVVNSDEQMPSDLKDIAACDLVPAVGNLDLAAVAAAAGCDVAEMLSFRSSLNIQPQHSINTDSLCDEFEVHLYYSKKLVVEKICRCVSGCLLYYGEGKMPIDCLPPEVALALYSEPRAEPLWLPPCNDLMDDRNMENYVQTVFERGMERGILLQAVNNNIVAYRLCKCSIFHASSSGTQGSPIKLPLVLRNRGSDEASATVIFDYNNWFLPALYKYAMNEGPAPDPRVFLLIGTEKHLDEMSDNVPVYATVTSGKAQRHLHRIAANKVAAATASACIGPEENMVDALSGDMKQMSLETVDTTDVWDLAVTAELVDYGLELNAVGQDWPIDSLLDNMAPLSTDMKSDTDLLDLIQFL